MSNVVIAKNQTAGTLPLPGLSIPNGELPASPATVTLTDWNTLDEIQNDPDLPPLVGGGSVVLEHNGDDLSVANGLLFLGAGSGDLIGPDASVTNNIPIFDGTSGKYLQDSGVALNAFVTVSGAETISNKRFEVDSFSTSPQTLTYFQTVILVNAGTVPITLNLPTAVGAEGFSYYIKKIDGTSNNVTIDPSGAETIENISTYVFNTALASIQIVSDGSNWFIIG